MKLQCDQCGSKYVISDDKVRGNGRVFKIRCKSCSALITVQGLGTSEDSPSLSTEEWYWAIDGNQTGPISADALNQAFQAGDVDNDTYVWKAGMDDWKLIGDVDELSWIVSDDELAADEDAALDDLARAAESSRTSDAEDEPKVADSTTPGEEVAAAVATTEEDPMPPMDEETDAVESSTDSEPAEEPDAMDDDKTQVDFNIANALMEAAQEQANDADGSDPSTETAQEQEEQAQDQEAQAQEREEETEQEEDVGGATLDNLFVPDDAQSTAGALETGAEEEEDDLDGLSGGETNEAGAGADKMVWKRNENSVLFTMDDLEEKEENKSKEEQKKAAAMAALTADSGLIDIRAFTKKQQQQPTGDLFAALSGDKAGSTDSPSSPAVTVTSAAPMPIVRRKRNTGAIIAAVALGMVLVAGGTAWFVIKYMVPKTDQKTESTAATVAAPDKATAATASGTKANTADSQKNPVKKPTTSTAEENTPKGPAENTMLAAADTAKKEVPTAENVKSEAAEQPEDAAKVQDAKPKNVKPREPPKPLTRAERRAKAKRDKERREKLKALKGKKAREKAERDRANKEKKAKEAARKQAAAAKKKKPRIDPNKLLGQIKKSPSKSKSGGGANDANLPQSLSSLQIKRVVRKAARRIRRCVTNAGLSGVQVTTSFTITKGGGVSGARVRGAVASSSAAGCVRSAIKSLRFPKSRSSKRVNYPFYVK